jgi:hypothetical protein
MRMMTVDITATDEVRIGRPRLLFEGEYLTWGSADYDVTPDGKRFLMVRPASTSASRSLAIRLNWREELKRAVGQ